MSSSRASPVGPAVAVLVTLAVVLGCDGPTQPRGDSSTADLLPNGSFERDGQPSLEGWRLLKPSLARSVEDAPTGGGVWSLQLDADWAPSLGVAFTAVRGVRTGDRLHLTTTARAANADGGAIVELMTGHVPFSFSTVRWAATSSTAWTELSVDDTVSLSPGDSVWVVLSSPPTEVVARSGRFDLVKVVRQ